MSGPRSLGATDRWGLCVDPHVYRQCSRGSRRAEFKHLFWREALFILGPSFPTTTPPPAPRGRRGLFLVVIFKQKTIKRVNERAEAQESKELSCGLDRGQGSGGTTCSGQLPKARCDRLPGCSVVRGGNQKAARPRSWCRVTLSCLRVVFDPRQVPRPNVEASLM